MIKKKICSSCGKSLSRKDFGRNARNADGLKIYCRKCVSIMTREWRLQNPKAYETSQVSTRCSRLLRNLEWDDAKVRKECGITCVIAHRCGILKRPDHCEVCGKKCRPQCHHEDHRKPLEVKYACRDCHYKLDVKRRERLGIEVKRTRRSYVLSLDDYQTIKALYAGGMSQVQISKKYGVNNSTISKIVNGKIKSRDYKSKLIRECLEDGLTPKYIAKLLNTSIKYVYSVRNRMRKA